MKAFYLIITSAILVTVFSLSSCKLGCYRGSGTQATETRKTGDFKQIEISGEYVVNIKQDSSETISITADDNLLKRIITRVDGDKLKIYSKKSLCNRSGQMVLNIGVRHLDDISASGAIDITSDGKLTVQDINLGFSGISKVNLDLTAANVTTDISGSAHIRLNGQAASHQVTISGSGKLDALDFIVGRYTIETSGVGRCKINVQNELNISSSGASEIEYRGNPGKISNDKSGASSLTRIN